MKRETNLSMKLFCENKPAINIAHNPIQHGMTKHIEVDRHFIKEKIKAGIICIPFVTTKDQIANVFTKGLFKPTFELFVSKLSMNDIHAST